MRYYLALLVIGTFLGITSCVKKIQQSPRASLSKGDYEFTGLAGKEYRYETEKQCDDAAVLYRNNNYPSSPTSPPEENLTIVSQSPKTYSIKAKDEDIEVRFTVIDIADITKYGKLIYYYKVNAINGHTEHDDVDLASAEFKKRFGHVIKKSTFKDEFALEKKYPWRAILSRKKPKSFLAPSDEEEYGIVINPPYPR